MTKLPGKSTNYFIAALVIALASYSYSALYMPQQQTACIDDQCHTTGTPAWVNYAIAAAILVVVLTLCWIGGMKKRAQPQT
jgi:hypothetical protein